VLALGLAAATAANPVNAQTGGSAQQGSDGKQVESVDKQSNGQPRDRVRAKEPTVVTVRGKADQVDPEASEQRGGVSKVGHGIRDGVGKVWNGIVSFGGWLLNKDDDIPSDRERRSNSKVDQR
jgi:hypothetical protein